MNLPELPEGWSYEYAELAGRLHTRARHSAGRATFWQPGADEAAHEAAAAIAANLADAISAGLISAHRSVADRPPQLDMFGDLAAPQLAEDRHTLCPIHGRFYQPHCWHCKRRNPDRPHKRGRQG